MPKITRTDSTQTETDDQGQKVLAAEGGTTKQNDGTRVSTQEQTKNTTTTREDAGAEITFVLKINSMGC